MPQIKLAFLNMLSRHRITLAGLLACMALSGYAQNQPPTPPFAYIKGGMICHTVGKNRFESCRPPNNDAELNLVKERQSAFEARVKERLDKEKPKLQDCRPYYREHYQKHLDEAIIGGPEVWGFAGYASAQDYAKARANLYVSLLKQRELCS
jgi:hypothetical protein